MCRLLMCTLLRCARWSLLLCLLCLLVLLPAATSSASGMQEPVYQITESELTMLETNLAQLKSINDRLQTDLKAQSSEATLLRKELDALRKERERLRIKAQRNTWAAAALVAATVAIVK